MNKKDRGLVDNTGEWSTFGVTMKVCSARHYKNLKVKNISHRPWMAKFLGEGSVDQGGPFRDTLCSIVDELHSYVLPLLIPTQNNRHDHGLGQDLWTVNPSANSTAHLEMFKFLGALIGMAFRASHTIMLRLPTIFWKTFVEEEITMDDIEEFDAYAVQGITEIYKIRDTFSKEEFEEFIDLKFTTILSDGRFFPLCPDGDNLRVTFDDIDRYKDLVLKARIQEAEVQMNEIKKGFEIIVPKSALLLMTWRQFEQRVCGSSQISVKDLKSITVYSSCSQDNEYIQRFWRCFESFSNQKRAAFLKFVWGRANLPSGDELKTVNFKIYLERVDRYPDHDIVLPQSHTCFFQLDLPRYSTDEICTKKILYAIEFCGSIDTDNNHVQESNQVWGEDEIASSSQEDDEY